ncbi:putative endoplasmic reticulum membrane protein c16e8.02 [Quercus suber]|uniref:Endoplasmic reticulum membrane protein c16e8.02 n=1 Tax=Quercus suber TaxID=58331 RepID=A0AAW0IYE2_QUESU
MGRTGLFDLERHFAFYGAYHSNPINIVIHMIFVWPIFFTSLVFLYFTPALYTPSFQIGLFPSGLLVLNFGFLLALIYGLFYVAFDKKAGSLAALLCFFCWVVLAAQLICWTGQFIGHGVFERRAPALLDNLLQAFLMAPFFVLLEALQSIFGYEPYPGFHSTVKAKVDKEIQEWKIKKQKKIS